MVERSMVSSCLPHALRFALVPAARSATILVVDNESSERHFIKSILESCGYLVLEAPGGVEALEVLETHGDSVDLILSNAVLRRMSGTQLAVKVGQSYPGAKVILISEYEILSSTSEQSIVGPGDLEVSPSVLKHPFSPHSLSQRIYELLQESHESGRTHESSDGTTVM